MCLRRSFSRLNLRAGPENRAKQQVRLGRKFDAKTEARGWNSAISRRIVFTRIRGRCDSRGYSVTRSSFPGCRFVDEYVRNLRPSLYGRRTLARRDTKGGVGGNSIRRTHSLPAWRLRWVILCRKLVFRFRLWLLSSRTCSAIPSTAYGQINIRRCIIYMLWFVVKRSRGVASEIVWRVHYYWPLVFELAEIISSTT